MRGIYLFVGLTGVLLLGGCATGFWAKDYGVKALSIDSTGAATTLRGAIEKNPATGIGIVDSDCFNAPVPAGKALSCQQQRNSAMATMLIASDDLCQEHLKSIYGNDAFYNILTGSVATLFSGAASIAGGASAKSALAAISTFANAERSLLNETIYKSMLVTATSKKIRETRDVKAAALLPGNFGKSIDDYPVILAMRGVVDYHYSCSFMLGLEKALEEGSQGNTDSKRAKFELEKRSLELYVDNRTASLTGAGRSAEIASDKGIAGAKARVAAIEAQLLALVNSQSPNAAAEDKGTDGPAKADPATLSKAFYSLKAGLVSGKVGLLAKIDAVKPATALTEALKATLNAKTQVVTQALGTQKCEATVNTMNDEFADTQGKLAAATGDARLALGDKLNAAQIEAGRHVTRLNAFAATYTTTLSAQGKAIEDAKLAIDAALNTRIDGAINGIAVPTTLCAR
jgi:hypothetical protein